MPRKRVICRRNELLFQPISATIILPLRHAAGPPQLQVAAAQRARWAGGGREQHYGGAGHCISATVLYITLRSTRQSVSTTVRRARPPGRLLGEPHAVPLRFNITAGVSRPEQPAAGTSASSRPPPPPPVPPPPRSLPEWPHRATAATAS